MQYKTTYFKINLNKEISVSEEVYKYRLNPNLLSEDIEKEESIYQKHKVKGLNSFELREITKIDKTLVAGSLRQLIFLRTVEESLFNCRYNEEHEAELNSHLNEIAAEGWKLLTMNTIIKGLADYRYSQESGFGYGHDVIEGFVLVWEKE